MNFDQAGQPSQASKPGTCILCHNHQLLAKSHVVSDFVQQRLMGEVTPGTTKHRLSLSHANRTWNSQKLPQFPLMCSHCDNSMGSNIETIAAQVLLGGWSVTSPCDFSLDVRLRLRLVEVGTDDFGTAVSLSTYETWADDLTHQRALGNFATLTAWRALHAMRISGSGFATEFLATAEGKELDSLTRKLMQGLAFSEYESPIMASLLALPASTVFELTGDAALPTLCVRFATLGDAKAMAVRFGLWHVVWPLNRLAMGMLDELEDEFLRSWLNEAQFSQAEAVSAS